MMRVIYLFTAILLYLIFPGNLLADISGRIMDSTTTNILPGANVYIIGTSIGAASDLNGEYRISKIEPGSYTLRVSYIGYKSKDVPFSLEENENLNLDVNLNSTFIVFKGKRIMTACLLTFSPITLSW